MAIDTNDIKCEYTLRETEFHTSAFLNGQQKIDLTTPFNGKAEHKMGDIVSKNLKFEIKSVLQFAGPKMYSYKLPVRESPIQNLKLPVFLQNFSSLTQTSPNHINQMFFDKNGVVQKTVDIKIPQDGKLVVAETANGVTLFTYFNKA